MAIRSASARWEGDLPHGSGKIATGSGSFEGSYSFPSRFESGKGTNPEELIAAAHAGCFSMALSHLLAAAGHVPQAVDTTAQVKLDQVEGGFAITSIALSTVGVVPGITETDFLKLANDAKSGCPVSKALASVEISLVAKLAQPAAG
jgi:lipoyl-dependent peroxiredoxin